MGSGFIIAHMFYNVKGEFLAMKEFNRMTGYSGYNENKDQGKERRRCLNLYIINLTGC
jgi:hypothetical protein